MTTETLSPVPKLQFFDNNGNPLVGGKLFTYTAGTSTKLATYTSSTGGTPNSNPIVLDFRGEANVWLPPNVPFKFVLSPATDTDPPGSPIWTVDQIINSQLITLYGGVDTGSANIYVLTFVASFSSYTDGIIVYWVPAHTNTGPSTVNINGIGVASILSYNGLALNAGDIAANSTVGMIYRSGNFYLLSTAVASGSFTATLSGMTATVTGTVDYKVANRVVTLSTEAAITGTSNQTYMVMTGLPGEIASSLSLRNLVCGVVNNGVALLGAAQVDFTLSRIVFTQLEVSGTTIPIPGSAFLNSGTKGVAAGWTITYPI